MLLQLDAGKRSFYLADRSEMFIRLVVIVAIIAAIGSLLFLTDEDWGAEALIPPAAICVDEVTAKALRVVALAAINDGFSHQVSRLYEVWMREDALEQPQRISRGMERAIRAYLYGQEAVQKWVVGCR